jgi:phospholipid/cholesterol/gamma-HCH transport system substrate-binding protein
MMNMKWVYVFGVVAVAVFSLLIAGAGRRQGWFAATANYTIEFPSGDGVFVGTPVSINGLKAGRVTKVELNERNQVVVEIGVQSKYAEAVREDSVVSLARPFIIGEREIFISAGSRDKPRLDSDSDKVLKGEVALELTDMLSGGRLAPYFQLFTRLMDQMAVVVEGDKTEDGVNLLKVYRQAYTAMKAVESMSKDFHLVRRDFISSPQTQQIMKDMAAASGHLGELLAQMNKTLPAVTGMSSSMHELTPQLTKALQETVFTMQAMQRSFVLRSAVEDLKEEGKRSPASEDVKP